MKKNGKNIILDDDVTITSSSKMGKTLRTVIDEQQEDINRLKSNVKYIYSYGGVGGTGGGGGSSESTSNISLYATLNNDVIGDNPILLNGEGKYTFYAKARGSGGKTFYLRVISGENPDIKTAPRRTLSTELNNCEYTETLTLTSNGIIRVQLLDSDGDPVDEISQNYILYPHEYNSSFKYYYGGGKYVSTVSNNEYIMGSIDGSASDPFIEMSYKINVGNASNVKMTCSVGDFFTDTKTMGMTLDNLSNPWKINIEDIIRNDLSLLTNDNAGTYHVNTELVYTNLGNDVVVSSKYDISLIPSYLFINARPDKSVVYETEDDLNADTSVKSINPGEYISFFMKVYDGNLGNSLEQYKIECNVYDYVGGEYVEDEYQKKSLIVNERAESLEGISLSFSTPGIKKILFTTQSPKGTKTSDGTLIAKTYKYVYVNEPVSEIDWNIEESKIASYFFRANQGDDTYSDNFPRLSSGNNVLEMHTNSSAVSLEDEAWRTTNATTTMLSIGIQLNEINGDLFKIFDVYSPVSGGYNAHTVLPTYTLKNRLLFEDTESLNDILIPKSSDYNPSTNKNYHLVQLVRQELGALPGETQSRYANLLYIDGKIECCDYNTSNVPLYISKIVLNNINASYNLIDLQYLKTDGLNIDGYVYKYWLSYKEKYINIAETEKITDDEKVIYNMLNQLKFDGSNAITTMSTVHTIARILPIPTMVFDYCPGSSNADGSTDNGLTDDPTGEDKNSWQYLMDAFLMGYTSGASNKFGKRNIDLWWSSGNVNGVQHDLHKIVIPLVNGLSGSWSFGFQGTSTMNNRIKNFSLYLNTKASADNDENILFSPNFKKGMTEDAKATFLPENEWTIKADIADSAHANNCCVGKFVNKVCTKFNTNSGLSAEVSSRIRNTLEGFPVLMFFRCDSDERVFYFGVYNFNLGRGSQYNLGYATDIEDVYNDCDDAPENGFTFTSGKCERNPNLAVGEIQENMNQFDFSQYHESLLFAGETQTDKKARMFGTDSKITGKDISAAKKTLQDLVYGVAKAGRYVFSSVGKTFGDNAYGYSIKGQVPDTKKQIHVENNEYVAYDGGYDQIRTEDLLELICDKKDVAMELENTPLLDYTSASEYYVIMLAFGLVDSPLKNMNIKSWNGKTCYIAYYDMDCAFKEDNAGNENISYLAGTDQWTSKKTADGYLSGVNVDYDYWDNSIGGVGFDFTSSYLFGVVKYAQSIFSNNEALNSIKLTHFPQEFWALLRAYNGELRSAEYFMENYYSSGVHKIPSYLTSLNYRVKYLYYGEVYDESTNKYISKFIGNVGAFHGTRTYKAKEWLDKRIKFLDVTMNISNLSDKLPSGIPIAKYSDTLSNDVKKNSNVSILSDAFTTDTENRANNAYLNVPIEIKASKNTPFIFNTGSTDYNVYLLDADCDNGETNKIKISTSASIVSRFFGSKEFTDVNIIEPFVTTYNTVVSSKLTAIRYGGKPMQNNASGYNIYSPTIEEIYLPVSTWSGELKIDKEGNNGMSVSSIDISGSGFYGDFTSLPNLRSVNISGLNASTRSISLGGNNQLNAGNIKISGTNDNKTKLYSLNITSIPGSYSLSNTAIQTMSVTSVVNSGSFSISGDEVLTTLSLSNFDTVRISNCPELTKLVISGVCRVIDINGISIRKINSDEDGVFDFSGLDYLGKISIKNCVGVEKIILPNTSVYVNESGLSGNNSLMYIDTEGDDSKLIINGKNVFQSTSNYNLRQSNGSYTKMSVGSSVTSLQNTFYSYGSSSSNQLSMEDVRYFIENVVPDEVKSKITSLQNCFYNRDGISYTISDANIDEANRVNGTFLSSSSRRCPDFSKYINLSDVSGLFANTKVNFLYRELFNFGSNISSVKWENYASNSNTSISVDTLIYISKKIITLSNIYYSIYEWNGSSYVLGGSEDNPILITDVLMPNQNHSELPYDEWETNERITSINGVSLGNYQYVDFNNMFKLYPNVSSIYGFLSGDLTKFSYNTILSDCTKLTSIRQSFTHNSESNLSETEEVDLWEFFNWESNDSIKELFETYDSSELGFRLNKVVSYQNMIEILNRINEYENITKLTNIFAYCTITDCDDNMSISFADKNDRITIINHLFYKCKSDRDSFGSLKFADDFFSKLPNVTTMIRTFYGVNFASMFGMDFFNRKSDVRKTVYIQVGDDEKLNSSWDSAILVSSEYNRNLVNLNECFAESKFVNCKCWFDPIDYTFDTSSEYVDYNGDTTTYKTYYQRGDFGKYVFKFGESSSDIYCFFLNKNITFQSGVTFSDIVGRGKVYFKYDSSISGYVGYQYVDGVFSIVISKLKNNASYINESGTEVNFAPFSSSMIGKDEEIISDITYRVSYPIEYNAYKYTNPTTISDENDSVSDLYNNYTNYVKSFRIPYNSINYEFDNHNIDDDLTYYSNNNNGYTPFVKSSSNIIDTYKTYCCLPTDILYACTDDTVLTGVFRNTNIIGVIPLHFTKNCKSANMESIFRNTNIMPNLEYLYDSRFKDARYMDEFEAYFSDIDIDVESETEDVACVIYRDSDGVLKRRYSTDSDKERAQYVYVPSGYTERYSIKELFNFRYNLPESVNLMGQSHEYGDNIVNDIYDDVNMTWGGKFNQYFFLKNDSVNWNVLKDASNPFISTSDYRFKDGQSRSIVLLDGVTNSWWNSTTALNPQVNGVFNSFLNLCCSVDANGLLVDCGCPVIITNNITLDNFVTGYLLSFLSGRIFNSSTYISEIKTSNNMLSSSNYILNPNNRYNGTGVSKNIILPGSAETLLDNNLRFINVNGTLLYDLIERDSTSKVGYGKLKNCNITWDESGYRYNNTR